MISQGAELVWTLKRDSRLEAASVSLLHRQITEGVWKSPEDLISQSQKRTEDRSADLDILNSPPLSLSGLSDLSTSSSLANWMPVSAGDGDTSGSEQDVQPPMALRNRVLDELPGRRPGDKCLSAEVRLVRTRVGAKFKVNEYNKESTLCFFLEVNVKDEDQ